MPADDEERLHDEAVADLARDDAVPTDGFGDVAGVEYDTAARTAAMDLSVLDGRFAPAVLEACARRALDGKASPATMTVVADLSGRRYWEDRDTAAVLAGSKRHAGRFTERWTLALDGDGETPWRIVAVQ